MANHIDDDSQEALTALRDVLEAFRGEGNGLFDEVGPSSEFMNTQLEEVGVTPADVNAIIGKIDEALERDDVQIAQKLTGGLVTLFKTVKDVLL